MWHLLTDDPAELQRYKAAWEDLVRNATEPNAFYEPWFALPALKAFPSDPKPLFLLVFDGTQGNPETGRMCGLFPLQKRSLSHKIPLPVLGLWHHRHCFLSTPLVRSGLEEETLKTFCDWITGTSAVAPFVNLQVIRGEGPFVRALRTVLCQTKLPHAFHSRYDRAFLWTGPDFETYLEKSFSARSRKQFRRDTRRLEEAGRFEERELTPSGNLATWVEDFLRLEAGGWKGRQKEALRSAPAEETFFREMAEGAFQKGALKMLGLFVNDRPIAMLCDLRAGDGAFAFKTAFDEDYSKYSPGVMVELSNLRNLVNHPEIRWIDSCASPHGDMINRMWEGRRPIQSVLIGRRRLPYGLLTLGLRCIQKIRQAVQRARKSSGGFPTTELRDI